MHFDINNPTGTAHDAAKEVEDATIGTGLETTEQSGNISLQSSGANTRDTGDSGERSDGINGGQADSNDNVTGLGDAEANAPSQGGTDGAGDTASKPSNKKSWFSKG